MKKLLALLLALSHPAFAVTDVVLPSAAGSAPLVKLSDGRLIPATVVIETDGAGNFVAPGTSNATAANQITGNASLSSIDTKVATAAKQPALGTAGTPSADVITVQGASGGTALPVSVSAATITAALPAGTNNIGDVDILSQPARTQATDNISLARFSRSDTYTGTGNGTTVDASAAPVKYYAVQVTGTDAGATTWDVRLECSLDNVGFTSVVQHTNADLDTVTKAGSAAFPCLYLRSRVAGLSLGSATNIVVKILGVQ